MKRFSTLAASLALAIGLTAALPAQAAPDRYQADRYQPNRHQDAWRLTPARNSEIRQDIYSLDRAIDRAAARRTISPREAGGLRAQARDIKRIYASYSRDGLSRKEVRNLETRVNTVRVALRMERRDWDNRRG